MLTSLVDVLFVLLFFFMLVTTYGDWRSWSMALAGAPGAPAQAGTLTVRVLQDGGLMLGAQRLPLAQIEAQLRRPQARAILVAEPGVNLQALVDVLDQLRPTGAALSLGREARAP